jgi:hypothetical protein
MGPGTQVTNVDQGYPSTILAGHVVAQKMGLHITSS